MTYDFENVPGIREITFVAREDLPYRVELPDEWRKGNPRRVNVFGPDYVMLDRTIANWVRENSEGKAKAIFDNDHAYIAFEKHSDATFFKLAVLDV